MVAHLLVALLIVREPSFGAYRDELIVLTTVMGFVLVGVYGIEDAIIASKMVVVQDSNDPMVYIKQLIEILVDSVDGEQPAPQLEALDATAMALASPERLKRLSPVQVSELRTLHALMSEDEHLTGST